MEFHKGPKDWQRDFPGQTKPTFLESKKPHHETRMMTVFTVLFNKPVNFLSDASNVFFPSLGIGLFNPREDFG